MPYFPTESDLFNILQIEAPEGVYPQGAPSAYFSTADNDSIASIVATAYQNAAVIYNNFWPQTLNVSPANGEKINDWEIKIFGSIQDTTQTLQVRINNILAKIRNKPAISLTYVAAIVANILAVSGVAYDILEWGSDTGGWVLDFSQLEINTFLNPGRVFDLAFGSSGDLADDQQTAYTYEIRIYGTIPDVTYQLLDSTLTKIEPARSTHVITQGLNPNDELNGTL